MTDLDQTSEQQRHPEPTARFVGAMIVLTIIIFLIAVALLALQWLRTTEPAAELLIYGNQALTGAKASVRSVDESTPYTSVFGSGGRFTLPFYLDPGSYIVQVHDKNGALIDEREVAVRERERIIVDLSRWERKLVTTAPAEPQSSPPSNMSISSDPSSVIPPPATAPAFGTFP